VDNWHGLQRRMHGSTFLQFVKLSQKWRRSLLEQNQSKFKNGDTKAANLRLLESALFSLQFFVCSFFVQFYVFFVFSYIKIKLNCLQD
jgi:hypothetical protein